MNKNFNTTKQHLPYSQEDAGSLPERVIFRNRPVILALIAVLTTILAYQAVQIRPDASFLKMIPTHHPYIANYIEHSEDLKGLGSNSIRIAVETTKGDIFTREYLETLQKITDEVFYIPGVNRGTFKSLWTPSTRWVEVTEEGFDGGAVIPSTYDGSSESLQQLKINVFKSGEVGKLVANNFKSSVVHVPLMEINPETGERLDYHKFSERLEHLVRDKYQSNTIKIHIVGFAKVVGDLIDGLGKVVLFFLITLVITLVLLFAYSRGPWSTINPLLCSLVAVVWQLGILHTLGYGLDPYSMLVPFLIFAIGVSHGVQIINAIKHETMNGADKVLAARRAFRGIYAPGLTALVTDGIGFSVLMVIQIGVIQDLAVGASLGVAVLIITNLVLLPILMSYSGVSTASIQRLKSEEEEHTHPVWRFLAGFASPRQGLVAIVFAGALLSFGLYTAQGLKIGDLDPGAPELRPDSRYNLDNAFMMKNYSASSDVFVVMLETPVDGNGDYSTLVAMDRLQWELEQLKDVRSTVSLVDSIKMLSVGFNEGNLKWASLTRSRIALNGFFKDIPEHLRNINNSLSSILIFLDNHKAGILQQVVDTVEVFAAENNTKAGRFLLAAGNAGIEATTNIVIAKAQYLMLAVVYGVVVLLCLLTFRSLRAVISIVVPLALTSVLCQALMAWMGIGVKVATLPVIALGVGVGVDYGIYIYSKLRYHLRQGESIRQAYFLTMKTTGKAVAFTGVTLAIGVSTWAFSPIKFQADMGILLTFMFLVNMLGAIILLPALASRMLRKESITKKAKALDTEPKTV